MLNVKLKRVDDGFSHPMFEIKVGKVGYRKFLKTVGYTRTCKPDTPCYLHKIKDVDIVDMIVVLMGNVLYFDYSSDHDLVFVNKINWNGSVRGKQFQEYIENILSVEFSNL